MSRHRVVKTMNRHPYVAFLLLSLVGWAVLMGKEVAVLVHGGHGITTSTLVFALVMALVSLVGAGIAGLAIDVLLLVREEQAGEVD